MSPAEFYNRILIALFSLALLGAGVLLGARYFGMAQSSQAIPAANAPAGENSKTNLFCDNHGRLERLIVLDAVFNGPDENLGAGKVSRLGELIILDGLFGPHTQERNSNDRFSRLERLIVLDAVFNNRRDKPEVSRLGDLIILEGLFSDQVF